jgi:hypothetical protein
MMKRQKIAVLKLYDDIAKKYRGARENLTYSPQLSFREMDTSKIEEVE